MQPSIPILAAVILRPTGSDRLQQIMALTQDGRVLLAELSRVEPLPEVRWISYEMGHDSSTPCEMSTCLAVGDAGLAVGSSSESITLDLIPRGHKTMFAVADLLVVPVTCLALDEWFGATRFTALAGISFLCFFEVF